MTKTRVVVPKIQARLFRLHKDPSIISVSNDVPQEIVFRELTQMKDANEDGRIKGVEHETTALFGGVMQLNIGEDPYNKIFEEVIPNDHLEVFYRDVGDASENKKSIGGILQSFQRHKTLFARPPKFFGPIWKPEHQEKPTVVNTKLDAWDYLRIMQYYNIPRGKGDSINVKLIDMNRIKKSGEKPAPVRRGVPSTESYRVHSDLLDYMDHAIELYLGEMHNNERGTVMSPVQFSKEEEDLSIKMTHTDLKLRFARISTSGQNPGITVDGIAEDYSNIVLGDIDGPHITGESEEYESRKGPIAAMDKILKIDEEIEKSVADKDSLAIFRFMDAKIRIAVGVNSDGEAIGRLFRVVGEIVAIDQFGLAKLLTGAIAYDHGLHRWYTPVVDFDTDYVKKIQGLLGKLNGGTPSVGKLVYIRFRAGEIVGASQEARSTGTVTRQNLNRIAIFNRDSFGEFMKFFSRAPEMNFYTISKFLDQGMGAGDTTDIQRHPSFLSLAVSVVNFPQSRSVLEYTVFVGNTNDDQSGAVDVFNLMKLGLAIDEGTENEKIVYTLRTEYLKRSSSYAALIAAALKKDDKFISFMTNIPASYMRADVFTGSKFKTFSYDSLSIIRIIQILSSTMGGFPATNNPVQTGGGVGTFQNPATKVDNYPVFLANRVIIKPTIMFARDWDNERTWKGFQSITAAADQNKTGDKLNGWFFIRLRVGIKDQVADRSNVEFKIPIGSINDLSVVKGASLNHLFTFSFAENMTFLKNITTDERNRLTEDQHSISLEYRLGGQSGSASFGVSPPELNILTLQDMTQSATYDPLYVRAQVNRGITPKVDGSEELPVHNPVLGWVARTSVSELHRTGFAVIQNTTRSNAMVPKIDIINRTTDTVGKELAENPRLIGIKSFVDITDLKREVKTLRKLAEDPDPDDEENQVYYSELSSSRSKDSLFKLIDVKMPFKFDFNVGDKVFALSGEDVPANQSLKELLDSLEGLEDVTELDMAWSLPIEGYVIKSVELANDTRELDTALITLEENRNFFEEYMDTYSAVIFLDLLVKGIRYLLWTLSKSRFLGHVFLPADHIGYSQKSSDLLKSWVKKATGAVERDVPVVEVGSSIIFDVRDTNVQRRSLVVGGGTQKAVNWVRSKLGKSDIGFAKKVITGSSAHRLKTHNLDGDDLTLIWYVAKKKVYIGRDGGYMMRLNMTEGSFDWTIFFREDTIITRLSEYYLMNGMANYMISRGGV